MTSACAFGGASNVTLFGVVLTELALATLKPVRPVKPAWFVARASPARARGTPVTVTVYGCTDCVVVVNVTVLPPSTGDDSVRPGTSKCVPSSAADGSGGASNVTV